MIDEVTGNRVVECPLGYYDVEKQVFLVVEPILDLSSISDEEIQIMVINYGDGIRDNEVYKIINEFTRDDIQGAWNVYIRASYDKLKVERDNEKSKLEEASG